AELVGRDRLHPPAGTAGDQQQDGEKSNKLAHWHLVALGDGSIQTRTSKVVRLSMTDFHSRVTGSRALVWATTGVRLRRKGSQGAKKIEPQFRDSEFRSLRDLGKPATNLRHPLQASEVSEASEVSSLFLTYG